MARKRFAETKRKSERIVCGCMRAEEREERINENGFTRIFSFLNPHVKSTEKTEGSLHIKLYRVFGGRALHCFREIVL